MSFEGTRTEIKSFEELVPLPGLQKALLVTDTSLDEVIADKFIAYFPPDVDLTVVADSSGAVSSLLVILHL